MQKSTTPTLANFPRAPVWRKLAAFVYDLLILAALSMGYGALALWFEVKLLGHTLAEGEKANLGLGGFIGWVVVLVLFYCFFWRRGGQTLGMRAWRLRLVSRNNSPPSWGSCLLRALTAPVSMALLGLGYWWQWLDREHLTWHDRASGTQVLLLPKQKD